MDKSRKKTTERKRDVEQNVEQNVENLDVDETQEDTVGDSENSNSFIDEQDLDEHDIGERFGDMNDIDDQDIATAIILSLKESMKPSRTKTQEKKEKEESDEQEENSDDDIGDTIDDIVAELDNESDHSSSGPTVTQNRNGTTTASARASARASSGASTRARSQSPIVSRRAITAQLRSSARRTTSTRGSKTRRNRRTSDGNDARDSSNNSTGSPAPPTSSTQGSGESSDQRPESSAQTSGSTQQSTQQMNQSSTQSARGSTGTRPTFLGYVTPTGQIIQHPPEPAVHSHRHFQLVNGGQRPVRRRHMHRSDSVSSMPGDDLRPVAPKVDNTITEEQIFEKEENPMFQQPIAVKKPVDYVELCDNLLKKVQRLAELTGQNTQSTVQSTEQLSAQPVDQSPDNKSVTESKSVDDSQNSQNKVSEIDSILSDIRTVQSKIKLLTDIGKTFNKRDILIGAFCNTSANFVGVQPSTKGDYDRKSLECSRALETLFDDNVFGNPIGTTIHFVFSENNIPTILTYMDKLKLTTERPDAERLMFGCYRLDKVYRDDEVIRTAEHEEHIRFSLIFTDVETNASIRCYATNKVDTANVRVQMLDYSGRDIFDAIPDFVLRRVVHGDNLTKHIKKLTGTMPRERRMSIWEHILLVLDKDITYLNQGYKYLDIGENKMFKISREETEPCVITAIQPPYMKLHLACGHALSIMAIYGIVYEGKSEDTESIVCSMCRRNLIPKLVPAISQEQLAKFTVKTYKEADVIRKVDTSTFSFEKPVTTIDVIKKNHEQDTYIDGLFTKKDTESEESDDDYDPSTRQIAGQALMSYLGSMLMAGGGGD
ncbi:hypothetical protein YASMINEVIRUS_1206 [Yasminevirus sp. GU-2018]|uniref:Uncharacterized protein n=1 Tax=Yasminevirus sp. GU-2018 TaxID=2420051 RepID=A0A5K0UAC4_9VIRU|nr:hypothetical protein YASMINEVIRUS_1206 [Yasminevirus sp. GU-2018]